MGAIPPAEVAIDSVLVRNLLAEQHVDLADLPIGPITNGWDNAMVRLGSDLVVRLPRRSEAAPLIEHEQRWLGLLAPRLPVPIPDPVRIGLPGCGYPWRWSVCRWYVGTIAAVLLAEDRLRAEMFAPSLAGFLSALHLPAPEEAPRNPWRGTPLAARHHLTIERLEKHRAVIAANRARAVWDRGMTQPPWAGRPLWLHGDPHPLNLLLADDSTLAAVLDFGDIAAGDPASDLAGAVMHLDPTALPRFRAAYRLRIDALTAADHDALWARTDAWALSLAMAFLDGSSPGDLLHAVAVRTLRHLGVAAGV